MVNARKAGLPYLSDRGAELLAAGATREVEDGFAFSHDPRLKLKSLLRMTEGQVQNVLRELRAPVLLIHPDRGFPFPETIMNERLACIDAIEIVSFSGHHHIHLDDPEQIAPTIAEFLEK